MKSLRILAAVLLAATNVAAQTGTKTTAKSTAKGVQEPASAPTLNAQTVKGCYAGSGELVFNATLQFNSKGSCVKEVCLALGYPVAGTTGGNQCWCGKKYPPKSALTDDKNCNVGCTGYDLEACGGLDDYFTIYNTGLQLSVDTTGEESSSHNNKGGSTTAPPVKTVTGSTVVVTQTSDTSNEGGPNIGGIVAGVVVGVLVVAGAVSGMFFYLRKKRNKEIEEEHKRNAAVSSFISGKAPSSSSGGMSILDARLDPVMATRRMSDGSIADNQDYSRKILRVTNA
jgi:cell wall integrity and stress response component